MTALLILAAVMLLAFAVPMLTRLLGGPRLTKEGVMDFRAQGAQLVDVRSPGEFAQAHAPGCVNIPLKALEARLAELDPGRPVVVCCASGARSAVARSLLARSGFAQVGDAGPWTALL